MPARHMCLAQPAMKNCLQRSWRLPEAVSGNRQRLRKRGGGGLRLHVADHPHHGLQQEVKVFFPDGEGRGQVDDIAERPDPDAGLDQRWRAGHRG